MLISFPATLFMIVFFKHRRMIAYKNLRLCFPKESTFFIWVLLFKNIRSTFLGLVEAGIVWSYPEKARKSAMLLA